MISHILVKSIAKLVSLQNPGQPMGWPGWPVATALYFITFIPNSFFLGISCWISRIIRVWSKSRSQPKSAHGPRQRGC